MQKKLLKLSAFMLCAALIFGACKKKSDSSSTSPSNDSQSENTTAKDQSNYSSASNQSGEEADQTASGTPSNARMTAGISLSLVTGATVDTSKAKTTGLFVITYNGVSASGKSRTGWDSLWVVGGPWHTVDAYMISKYDYTITNSDGKTMTLVGTDTITNVSGGNLLTLISGASASLTTDHIGTAKITFDDGTIRTWHHARRKVRTYTGGVVTATVTGLKNISNYTGIEAWGTNRNGEIFYGQIQTSSPLIFGYTAGLLNTSGTVGACTHWWPYSGVYIHQGILSKLKVTYGVNSSGSIITPAIDCPYGIELDWTFLSASKQEIIAY
jgi:hypothetical protein